jgi:hypothetical protein
MLAVAALPVLLSAEALLFQPFRPIPKAVEGTLMVMGLVSGPLWGFLIPRRQDYRIARWTWAFPLTLFLICLYPEYAEHGWRYIFAEYIWPPDGSEGIGVLITLPVVSAVMYSLGAAFGLARARRRGSAV